MERALGAILVRCANPLIIITCPRADTFSEKPPPRLISCPNQQCSINQVANVCALSPNLCARCTLHFQYKITLFSLLLCSVGARANIFFHAAFSSAAAAGRQRPFFCSGKPPDRASTEPAYILIQKLRSELRSARRLRT